MLLLLLELQLLLLSGTDRQLCETMVRKGTGEKQACSAQHRGPCLKEKRANWDEDFRELLIE